MTEQQSPGLAPTSTPAIVRLDGDADDSRIDAYELFCARRALALLKKSFGRERLLDLLSDEIAAGEAMLREHADRSHGEQRWGTTILRADGISAAAFNVWLAAAFDREDVMLAGHPEHYAIHVVPGHGVNIVETFGDRVCSFFMAGWDESATSGVPTTAPHREGSTPAIERLSRMVLADGTVVGSITNAFFEEPGGFTVELSVGLPSSCDDGLIEQHLEHFAVEFRTWILLAAAESG